MNRPRGVTTAVALMAAVALAGCSPAEPLDLQAGWDWNMRREAASSVGAEMDWLTGEYTYPEGAFDAGVDLETALAWAEEDECRGYQDPDEGGPTSVQRFAIEGLLWAAFSAAFAEGISDELVAGWRESQTWAEQNGPDLADLEPDSEEWNAALDELARLQRERFEEQYPELLDEQERANALDRDLALQAFSSESVIRAQEFIVQFCGFDVADDFDYPTAEDFGIVVDEEFAERRDGNSDS